ncbi:MAG: septum formation initiator family protein [Clostridia bacterium]
MSKKTVPEKSGFFIRPRYILLFFLLAFFVLGGVYLSQQTKLGSIEDEKAKLQTKLDTLKIEEERLDRMLEYMQTTDYIKQYAREKLGFVFPSDIKFYDDTVTTKSPLSTLTPTDVPQPSINPDQTSTPLPTPVPKLTPKQKDGDAEPVIIQ